MIRLTSTDVPAEDRWVNPERIALLLPSGDGTQILFDNTEGIIVSQAPERVARMCNDWRADPMRQTRAEERGSSPSWPPRRGPRP